MSNISAILAHLNTPKYDAVRDQIRAALLARVESDFRAWSEDVLNFVVPEPVPNYIHTFPRVGEAGLYLNRPERVERQGSQRHYLAVQRAVALREYQIDKQKIQDAADLEWEHTKRFYAGRVGAKIDLLLEGDAEVDCKVSGSRMLLGTITAVLGQKRLVLGTSLKTNYRYGVFAADRKQTVYWQVPTVVESYSGFDLPAREAQIERETAAAKEGRKSEMAKYQEEIRVLEKQKRVWDEVDFSVKWAADGKTPLTASDAHRINEKLAKIGVSPVGLEALTRFYTYSKVKELRVALSTAKANLRLARKPKVGA